jgi:hypothetical protein
MRNEVVVSLLFAATGLKGPAMAQSLGYPATVIGEACGKINHLTLPTYAVMVGLGSVRLRSRDAFGSNVDVTPQNSNALIGALNAKSSNESPMLPSEGALAYAPTGAIKYAISHPSKEKDCLKEKCEATLRKKHKAAKHSNHKNCVQIGFASGPWTHCIAVSPEGDFSFHKLSDAR